MTYLIRKRLLLTAGILALSLSDTAHAANSAAVPSSGTTPAAPGQAVDFNRDIQPVLNASCVSCHRADKAEGRLRLDSQEAILQGGASGPIVVPGNSQGSLLISRLSGSEGAPRMPLGGDPLPKAQIDKIRAWIDQGGFPAASASTVTPSANSEARQGTMGKVPKAESQEFVAQIRPILAERCVGCHGSQTHENQLRLDTLAGILKGGASGKIVVPGNSENSRLVRRLMGRDQPRMPYGAPPLSSDQIALIRGWIDSGAEGPDSGEIQPASKPVKHWAYVKPVRPQLPSVKNVSWCRNSIDHFVLSRLEKEGLSPSSEASKETLIRRLSLDLVGLPPTTEEVDAFVGDTTPEAYDRLVDRLLSSPHYGERWARPWLDLARYADTHGYEKDGPRVAWKFRDWVINALNQNMSFREFTIEQIAGDMLPNATLQQRVATGFHRNTMLNQEGGVDDEEYRFYNLIDRVNTTASVWLGSTLACAQCHNHKYDPFTQKDYYRFLAFFDNSEYQISDLGQGEGWVEEPEVELPTPEQQAKSKELRAEMAKLQVTLDTSTPDLEAAQVKWEEEQKRADENWSTLRPTRYSSQGGATLTLQADGSILAGGKNPEADTYTLELPVDRAGMTALRIEVLKDPSLPKGGPGRDPEGNFFLSHVEVQLAPRNKPEAARQITFNEALADESQAGYKASNLVSKNPWKTGWAVDVAQAENVPRRQLVLTTEKPFGFEEGGILTVRLRHEMRHSSRNTGRFRISVNTAANPKFILDIPARLRPILRIPVEQRSPEQKKSLAGIYRGVAPALETARNRMQELSDSLKALRIPTAMVLKERNSFERPSTDFHLRGSYLNKGERVYAGVPSVLNRLPEDEMPNRLGLARWLVDPENPLTPRVAVNRYWETLFGRGLVETSEDFGTQGERPTHPELLDWLATEFIQQDWNIKALLRLMVTSAAYRQSSTVTPSLLSRDPYNRLLARGPRFRVEGESVRDLALAASGLLSRKIGGPSVFPYQPEGIWDRPYSDEKWSMSEAEDRYRRGLYTFLRRTAPYPSLVNFDAPTREFCTVRRPRTNTPLQSLTTLNDPVFFEAAQALARRLMKEAGPDGMARATYGFRLCVSRPPTQQELEQIVTYYDQETARFQKDLEAARKVTGSEQADPQTPQLAGWTMVSNLLLSLDETLTKE